MPVSAENKANKVVVRAVVRVPVAVEVAVVVVQVHVPGLVRSILSGRPVVRVAVVLIASVRREEECDTLQTEIQPPADTDTQRNYASLQRQGMSQRVF